MNACPPEYLYGRAPVTDAERRDAESFDARMREWQWWVGWFTLWACVGIAYALEEAK